LTIDFGGTVPPIGSITGTTLIEALVTERRDRAPALTATWSDGRDVEVWKRTHVIGRLKHKE
jgi:hypothetical protein